nr:immunoglobulin heavy chain junction region [Mus musculus]
CARNYGSSNFDYW